MMKMRRSHLRTWRHLILLPLVLTLAAPWAMACPVPVFRYALEFWESDAYEVYVFHKGELNADHQDALDKLRQAAEENPNGANMQLHEVNLVEEPNPRHLALWRNHQADSLPHVLVRYPPIRGIDRPVWTGPLDGSAVETLLDSPTRRKITRRLTTGDGAEGRDSAVWVLLESGDLAKDKEAAETLEAQLAELEGSLELPDAEAAGLNPSDPLYVNSISFSTLRVSKDDPAERMFVNMLLNSEPGLHELAEEPMVFPIYGRGLITYALVGRGINTWTLRQAGEFLAGATTCEVKEGNPGTDILLAGANWNAVADSSLRPPTPSGSPSGLGSFSDHLHNVEKGLRK